MFTHLAIRDLIIHGRVSECLKYIALQFPNILQYPDPNNHLNHHAGSPTAGPDTTGLAMSFRLQCLQFIECIRNGQEQEAMLHARSTLAPYAELYPTTFQDQLHVC